MTAPRATEALPGGSGDDGPDANDGTTGTTGTRNVLTPVIFVLKGSWPAPARSWYLPYPSYPSYPSYPLDPSGPSGPSGRPPGRIDTRRDLRQHSARNGLTALLQPMAHSWHRVVRAAAGLACVAVVFAAPANGQEPVSFDAWTIEDGLPQGSVNDIVQTRDGYLWLATYGGLVRFDGVRFVVFDRSVEGVGTLRTRTLYEDRAGTLWAGSDDGMILRYRDGRFETFGPEHGAPADIALRIEEDDAGVIWITWVAVVTRFDGETFTTFRPGDFPRDVRPHEEVPTHFWKQTTWWSRDGDGLHCLAAGVVRPCLAARLPDDDVAGVATGAGNVVTIRFRSHGVVMVDDQVERHLGRVDLPPSNGPRGYFVDTAGRTWSFGGEPGISRLLPNRTQRIADLRVIGMYEDREGSVWVGALDGIYRLHTPAITTLTTDDGLSSNNVYSLLRDRSGVVWVGTWGGGLNRYENGRFRSFTMRDGLPSDEITSVFEDAEGRLFVGTTRGLAVRNGEQFVRAEDPNRWLAGPVWAILEGRTGLRWFATEVGLVQRGPDGFIRYDAADGLARDRVSTIHEDRTGALWVGTSQGVTRLREGRFTSWTAADGFVGSHVRVIHEDRDGIVWIGTYDGGLYRIDQDDRLTRYTTREGLHDNGVFQLLEDDDGQLWIGCNRGIYRLNRRELNDFAHGRVSSVRSTVFGLADGMASLEANGGRHPSGLKMEAGTIWIPTQGGVAIIDPRLVRPNPHAPPVRVEEVRLRGEPVPLDRAVTVPADRPLVEIRYTAMSFVKPEQLRFRYRLRGLDEDWVEAGATRTVAYHRIPAGTYAFEVTAANGDGVWNPDGDRIAVVVLAPFWRRGWFLAAAGLAIVALALVIEGRRVVGLRRAHAQQQAFARQLLETQEAERRRISNELHDSLGQSLFLIRRRARTAREDAASDAAPGDALGDIADLASTAYDEMKEIAYDLRPYELDKIGTSRTIRNMLRRVSAACGLEIEDAVDDVDEALAPGAAIHVFRIVQEAIHNVVRHSGASRARVAVHRRDGRLTIEVSDDGHGLPAERATGQAGPGTGLTSIRERARSLGGEMALRSAPDRGASVVVTLPVGRAST